MKMYIDPGTGSMLFAILIGIIGVANYLLKSWIVKLRFLLHGGKKLEGENEKTPFVIFSDNKRYWNIFNPICRELDRRGIDVVYMTASPDDPALECPYEHVKGEFIGEGSSTFSKPIWYFQRLRDLTCTSGSAPKRSPATYISFTLPAR